ncbi:MAG: Zn-dependent oligopeptidase [Burkholderiaceae bacterium]|jgi:thimet oligopeptidase|nr:Zn-dependent oligopeptidase [Burkholderiaceae bacterium]
MTMIRRLPLMARFSVAVLLAGLAVLTQNAVAEERATIPVPGAQAITTMCGQGLADWKARVAAMEEIKAYTPDGSVQFMTEWNRLLISIDDVIGPVYLLSQVSPDKAVRDSAEACDRQIRAFNTDLYLNDKLYRSIRLSRTKDNVERKLRKDTLNDFEDAGITLMPKKRERMREIRIRLDAIQQEFSRNIRENKTRVVFSPEQMRGMQDTYMTGLKKDSAGNYLLDFSYPVYLPFMRYADDAEARRQYQVEFLNRGTPKNLTLLQEAITLRHEMANLGGYRSYADYKLRRRMAHKPGMVATFLDQVQKATQVAEINELDDLRRYKAGASGTDSSRSGIARWDVAYWQEKVRKERFDVDQQELRRYFPTPAAIRWTLGITERLFGISFQKADVPLWHEDVMYFDVLDKSSGELLGGIYLDLFPREGKYGHAAAFPVRGGSTLEGRKPISALVTNFNRTSLDGNELETLLHEFGHVLHGVLSKTRYVEQSGTSVERDFVEAPSQMLEEWAYSKEALALLPDYCAASCPRVDDDLLRRINQARKYGKGMFYARQLLYAKYDMALYSEKENNAMTLWENMEAQTPLGYLQGTQFPGQFNHTISGYAAGYYGYLWSKVLALDMLSQFGPDLMNPQVGMRDRNAILERGGEAYAEELLRAFLGRAPSSKAFYRELTGSGDQ